MYNLNKRTQNIGSRKGHLYYLIQSSFLMAKEIEAQGNIFSKWKRLGFGKKNWAHLLISPPFWYITDKKGICNIKRSLNCQWLNTIALCFRSHKAQYKCSWLGDSFHVTSHLFSYVVALSLLGAQKSFASSYASGRHIGKENYVEVYTIWC